MEKLKNKHDHALTQWLKVIIFGILMIAPFLSVLSRCLYVTCNKNAKDSYYGETINQKQYNLTKTSNLLINNDYLCESYPSLTQSGWQDYFICGNNFKKIEGQGSFDTSIIYKFGYNKGSTRSSLLFYTENNTLVYEYYFDFTTQLKFTFEYITTEKRYTFGNDEILTQSFIYQIVYNQYSYLDNAFEYSVNQLNETPIFNWVTNTGIYQPVNTMTSGLGFDANNNVMALLLTYWAILTAIYVLFDIIISCFVKLTHLVGGSA